MVMLTLTRDNMDQVIPLAGLLREKTGVFHFNRLALFGEGANLALPDPKRYRKFLEDYLAAAETNPVMGIKDNLINVLRREKGMDLFGGCAGYGCGAAFNFVSLLADGEVHACRKLPRPSGTFTAGHFRTFMTPTRHAATVWARLPAATATSVPHAEAALPAH
jgi:MoaA/NifB/PqqE/SkfB family radical SAM enzyme